MSRVIKDKFIMALGDQIPQLITIDKMAKVFTAQTRSPR